MKSVAIMQPTFLPWIGYFALIDRVDEFIFLDNVQFDKRSWQQRNKIKTANGDIWLSVAVSTKGKRDQIIKQTEILYEGDKSPLDKIEKSIEFNYSKAPFYEHYASDVFSFLRNRPKYISDLNQDLIKWACEKLNIKTPFIKASDLDVKGEKEILLLDICQVLSATSYVSPPGSKTYLAETDAFNKAKIDVMYHEYIHPEYTQLYHDFLPYMCILDLLFNEGPASGDIMRQGMIKRS